MNISEFLKPGFDLRDIPVKKIDVHDGNISLYFGREARQMTLGESGELLKPKIEFTKYPRNELYKFWPPNPGTFVVKDPASPVAFVCPRQDKILQDHAINFGAAISGPCMTPDRGVELLVTNTISNPNIRFLIMAGADSGHLAGDVLYCLNKYGADEKTKRVLQTCCPTNPYVPNLPSDAIKRFQEQVKVIDMLGCEDAAEIGLVIRCCVQEVESPVLLRYNKTKETITLCDFGSENREPTRVDLSLIKLGMGYHEGFSRVGSSIHSKTIADAYNMIHSHILLKGCWGQQESSRWAADTVATQIIVYDTFNDLIPLDWYPHGWMETFDDVKNYIEKYAIWVYLFPLSDVKYDKEENLCVPYIPEKMDYAYGTRLTAYWYELAPEKEKNAIRELVSDYHGKFREHAPDFNDVIKFYSELADVQEKSFNQLYSTAKAALFCRKNDISNSYRLYMSLQIPPIDINENPLAAHNPCFCLYEVYPRRIKAKWQLDAVFFLRAHDVLAFPANANGGITIQKFLSKFSKIDPGVYVHHAGSIHVCDYMLPKDVQKKFKKEYEEAIF